jgi:hypothetical protein
MVSMLGVVDHGFNSLWELSPLRYFAKIQLQVQFIKTAQCPHPKRQELHEIKQKYYLKSIKHILQTNSIFICANVR